MNKEINPRYAWLIDYIESYSIGGDVYFGNPIQIQRVFLTVSRDSSDASDQFERKTKRSSGIRIELMTMKYIGEVEDGFPWPKIIKDKK